MTMPVAATTRGARCPRAFAARCVPTARVSAIGRNDSPACRAEKPRTVCRRMEVRYTAATSRPVTPSISVVPDTRVVTFQVCGGSSGRGARVSTRANAVSSAAETTSAPRVRAEAQPCSAAPPRASISAPSPPIAVAAPGRSNRASPAGAVVSCGSRCRPATNATTPIGTFTQKMSCQPAHVVRAPPSRTPTATDRLPTAPHSARPRARWLPEYVVMMIDRAAGVMRAAPRPCAARVPMSSPALPAKPDSSDATVNTPIPTRKTRLRGSRSATRPPSSRPPPEVSR